MLPAGSRLRRRAEFAVAVHRGRRAVGGSVTAHLLVPEPRGSGPTRVGLIVGGAVGNAVARNRVRRRLRHLIRDRLHRLPAGSILVLRAHRTAANRGWAGLAADVDVALGKVTR